MNETKTRIIRFMVIQNSMIHTFNDSISNMLEIRLSCENCDKFLPNESSESMICSYECTFCRDCVDDILINVCPNCGGGFEKRPSRPKDDLNKRPPRTDKVFKPVKFNQYLEKNKHVNPRER